MTRKGPFGFLLAGVKRGMDTATGPAPKLDRDDAVVPELPLDPEQLLGVERVLHAPVPAGAAGNADAASILSTLRFDTNAPGRPLPAAPAQAAPAPVRVQATILHSPVFIVGSPRSGTSILTDGLIAAGYHGFREGNFLSLLRVYETLADRHRASFGQNTEKVLAGRVDWAAFKADINAVFRRHVDAHNPRGPWMDKTGNPEMIEAIPQILSLWPTAIFIFAKRRAIENIVSRLKKFPGHNFEYHCRDWARNMAAWRAIRDTLGVRGIEIDQQEIARAPERVATRLSEFLGASAEIRDRIRRTFATDRPQKTDDDSTARVYALESTGWSLQQRDLFMRLCGPEMELFGYNTEESYWVDGSMPYLKSFPASDSDRLPASHAGF